jgi:hypothetical protein
MDKVGYSTVDDIIDDILKTLPDEYTEKLKSMSSTEFCSIQHFNLGLLIRNKYYYQNPAQKELIKNMGGDSDYMLLDGDYAGGIILEALYKRITNK